MDKPAPKNTFDEGDRLRTRAAILAYKNENSLGVPTLIKHMAAAINHREDYIPQKTLQRFLLGTMRTNDAFVRICYDFAQTLPPARDELADMAAALFAFYKPAEEPPGTSAVRVPTNLNAILDETSMSFITINESKPARSYTSVEELIRPRFDVDEAPDNKLRYEGVLQVRGNLLIVLLRSNLTRLPRMHWLTQNADGTFQSVCQYEKFRASPEAPVANEVLTLRPLYDREE